MINKHSFFLLLLIGVSASQAQAGAQLAMEKGCFNCHGNPPRKNAPPFTALAQDYARYQGQPDREIKLANHLRQARVFGGIEARERLSDDSARLLVRWIIQGAK